MKIYSYVDILVDFISLQLYEEFRIEMKLERYSAQKNQYQNFPAIYFNFCILHKSLEACTF